MKKFWQTKKLFRAWAKIPTQLKTARLLTPKRRQYILRSDWVICILYTVPWFFVIRKLYDKPKNYKIQNFIIFHRDVLRHKSRYMQLIPRKEVFLVSLTLRPLRETSIKSGKLTDFSPSTLVFPRTWPHNQQPIFIYLPSGDCKWAAVPQRHINKIETNIETVWNLD